VPPDQPHGISVEQGRQFPAIFEAVADGRLHLSAVRLLGPFLTPENWGDLLAEAGAPDQARDRRVARPALPEVGERWG